MYETVKKCFRTQTLICRYSRNCSSLSDTRPVIRKMWLKLNFGVFGVVSRSVGDKFIKWERASSRRSLWAWRVKELERNLKYDLTGINIDESNNGLLNSFQHVVKWGTGKHAHLEICTAVDVRVDTDVEMWKVPSTLIRTRASVCGSQANRPNSKIRM